MYFRTIPEQDLSDPGPQLRSLLEYKERILEAQELLYKEYPNPDEWRKMFRDHLLTYVLTKCGYGQGEASVPAETAGGSPAGRLEKIQKLVPEQVQSILDRYAETEVLFDRNKVERLDLFISSLMCSIHADRSIDPHTVNRVYCNRNVWRLSDVETYNVLRSVISDSRQVNPGWYWVRGSSPEVIYDLIIDYGLGEANESVRGRILGNIDRYDLPISRPQLEKMLDDQANLATTLRLLKGVHGEFELEVALRHVESDRAEVRVMARSKAVQLSKKVNLAHAFELACRYVAAQNDLMGLFTLEDIQRLPPEIIIAAIEKQPSLFPDAFLRRIVEARTLSQEHYKRLLEIKSDRVMTMSYLGMVANEPTISSSLLTSLWDTGRPVSEDLENALIRSLGEAPTLDSINAYTLHGSALFGFVAERNLGTVGSTVRAQLRNGFRTFMDNSDAMRAKKYGDASSQYIFSNEAREFVRSQFIAVALQAISTDPQPEDLEYAFAHMSATKFGLADPACLAIIRKLGDRSVVPRLTALLSSSFGDASIQLARTILAISPTIESASELAHSNNTTILAEAASILLRQSPESLLPLANELILSENPHQRMLGVLLVARQPRDRAEKILTEYTARDSYYYNVVASLDAILYAPDIIGKWYLDSRNALPR